MTDRMEGLSGALSEHLRGIFCAHSGLYYAAEQAFLNALEAEPEMLGSYVELGLVYAHRGEYQEMVEILARAVRIAPAGVRAYLGGSPLGDIPGTKLPGSGLHPRPGAGDESGVTPSPISSAVSHLAEGRDEETARMLEQVVQGHPPTSPALVALLALAYLLLGEGVVADDAGVRRADVNRDCDG